MTKAKQSAKKKVAKKRARIVVKVAPRAKPQKTPVEMNVCYYGGLDTNVDRLLWKAARQVSHSAGFDFGSRGRDNEFRFKTWLAAVQAAERMVLAVDAHWTGMGHKRPFPKLQIEALKPIVLYPPIRYV